MNLIKSISVLLTFLLFFLTLFTDVEVLANEKQSEEKEIIEEGDNHRSKNKEIGLRFIDGDNPETPSMNCLSEPTFILCLNQYFNTEEGNKVHCFNKIPFYILFHSLLFYCS